MVWILVSFWDGLFSGAMLVSGRVDQNNPSPLEGVGLGGLLDPEEWGNGYFLNNHREKTREDERLEPKNGGLAIRFSGDL